jgi:siroheme synthase
MGVGEAQAIAATLLAAGKPAGLPVAVVENASLPDQRIRYTTLSALPQLAAAQIAGPALILLGPQFARGPQTPRVNWCSNGTSKRGRGAEVRCGTGVSPASQKAAPAAFFAHI